MTIYDVSYDDEAPESDADELRSSVYKGMHIRRCENGYQVNYRVANQNQTDNFSPKTIGKTRVFISSGQLFKFVEEYFTGEVQP